MLVAEGDDREVVPLPVLDHQQLVPDRGDVDGVRGGLGREGEAEQQGERNRWRECHGLRTSIVEPRR